MTESANNTTISPSFITDATGAVWSLVGGTSRGTQIARNGSVQTYTGFVVLLLYWNHTVYQQNSSGNWWYWNNSNASWVFTTDPRSTTTAAISGITLSNASFSGGAPSGTVVGSLGVTMSSGSWSGSLSLGGTDAVSFQIVGNNLVTNGILAGGSYSVSVTATQAGATGSPFTKTFTITGSAVVTPSITGITLSNSSFSAGVPSGTVVGAISVAMSSGTFSGALSLSGNNASSFQIVGSNLETNGVVNAGSYVVTVTATETGVTGSPFAQQFSLTATGATGNWWTTPPPQAAAAGFNTLKFGDDFTSSSTITLSNSTTQRNFNWYPASWGGSITTSMVQVNSTWKANDSNMQAQGVNPTSATLNNASPAGGIVRLQGGASNATLISVDGWISTFPTAGTFQHAYFEAYLQYQPGALSASTASLGWPGWWSWSMENIRGLGFGGSSFGGSYTEIDFWEYAVASNGLAWGGGAFHGSMSGGGYGYNSPGVVVDNNWHTIGCLWTPGNIKFYYDNVHVGSSSGTTTSASLEAEHQFIMIGCGLTVKPPFTIPMYVDWVRVWTA